MLNLKKAMTVSLDQICRKSNGYVSLLRHIVYLQGRFVLIENPRYKLLHYKQFVQVLIYSVIVTRWLDS
jgi:hypothetical protein